MNVTDVTAASSVDTEEEIRKLPHEVQIQVAERFTQFKSGLM